MTTPMSIREFAELTKDAVVAGEWNQAEGTPRLGQEGGGPCCVGAKLALFMWKKGLMVHESSVNNLWYPHGISGARELLGCSLAQLEALLAQAGAGSAPFTANPWPNDRETVWNNLMEIEELPEIDPEVDY